MAPYPKQGGKGLLTVVPAADLADVDSAANAHTSGRVGSGGIGKQTGMLVLRDNGAGDLDLAVATGDLPASPWLIYGREATVTPA